MVFAEEVVRFEYFPGVAGYFFTIDGVYDSFVLFLLFFMQVESMFFVVLML